MKRVHWLTCTLAIELVSVAIGVAINIISGVDMLARLIT